jgi:hypothetical protein
LDDNDCGKIIGCDLNSADKITAYISALDVTSTIINISVDNITYDSNSPPSAFHPMFQMGDITIGSYDGEIWSAKQDIK